jgi:hypothetical protein
MQKHAHTQRQRLYRKNVATMATRLKLALARTMMALLAVF